MKYNTVIFDLDGTLIDTLEDLKNSVNFALESYSFPKRTYDEIKSFVGNGVERLVNLSAPPQADERVRKELLAVFKAHYMEHSCVYTAPYPGITQLLSLLKKSGIRTAVVTNKMQPAAVSIVRHFFADTVDIVIGQVDGLARKPEPDGVWRAIEELGSSKKDSVYVGDSDVDCLTAKNSGLPIIGCVWGFRGRQVLAENGADYIVDTPAEIFNIITGK